MRHEPQSGGSEAVGQEPRPVDFPEVLEDELEEVIKRRREAGLHVPTPGDEAKAKVDRTLVGLSLSGGGSARRASASGSSKRCTRRGCCGTSTT